MQVPDGNGTSGSQTSGASSCGKLGGRGPLRLVAQAVRVELVERAYSAGNLVHR